MTTETTQQSERAVLPSVLADGETLVLQWQLADRSKGFSILFAADGTVSLATKRSKTEFYANNCKEYRLDSPDLEEAIKSGFAAVNERPALLARIKRLEEALKPFAALAPHYPMKGLAYGNRPRSGPIYSVSSGDIEPKDAEITVEHLHTARAALTE